MLKIIESGVRSQAYVRHLQVWGSLGSEHRAVGGALQGFSFKGLNIFLMFYSESKSAKHQAEFPPKLTNVSDPMVAL